MKYTVVRRTINGAVEVDAENPQQALKKALDEFKDHIEIFEGNLNTYANGNYESVLEVEN